MPFPAPSRVARSTATAAAAGRPSASPSSRASPPVRRYASTGARSVGGAAIPWAVAGRTSPRDTLVKGSGERGALLPLSPRACRLDADTRRGQTSGSSSVNVNSASNGSAGRAVEHVGERSAERVRRARHRRARAAHGARRHRQAAVVGRRRRACQDIDRVGAGARRRQHVDRLRRSRQRSDGEPDAAPCPWSRAPDRARPVRRRALRARWRRRRGPRRRCGGRP